MTRTPRVPGGTPVRVPIPPAGQAVPASGNTQTGSLTQDSTAVTGLPVDVRTIGWLPGMIVAGNGLPKNTLIAAIDNTGRALTLSNPAAVTGNTAITVYPLAPWTPLGPMVTGSNQAKGNPRITGRFRALAVSDDGLRVYAGSALGGLWYSADGGETWKALDHFSTTADSAQQLHFADALTVGALAVKWDANPARDVVYVGSGEHPVLGPLPGGGIDSQAMGQGIRAAIGPSTAASPDAVTWMLEAAELTGMVVNRLAPDRVAGTTIWAATSLGLYRRRVNGNNITWQKVDPGLGDGEIGDVVVVAGLAGEQERVYAATPKGQLARSVDGGPWQVVNLPEYPTRPNDATPVAGSVRQDRPIRRVRLAGGNVPGVVVVYVLAEGPRLWRVENDAAHKVSGLPEDVFDEAGQPSPSGLCLAVHPLTDATHQNLIAIGGQAYTGPDGRRQAALFRGQLTQNAAGDWDFPGASWAGEGIPAGMHALAWVPDAASPQLWAAGECGLFQSPSDGQPGSFRSRSSGLPAVETEALAQSPDGRVMLLAARQGVLEQVSGETWKLALPGRIGGVAVDPGSPSRLYAQVLGEGWEVLDRAETDPAKRGWHELKFLGGPPPTVVPHTPQENLWKEEKGKETSQMPASRPALIANPIGFRGTQIALGTTRMWYSDAVLKAAAGGSSQGWVTLPSNSDAFGGAVPDLKQDALDSPVRMACWASPEVLFVLTAGCLYRLERQVDHKTGNTHGSTAIDQLSENVWESGWQPGLPIRGVGIPPNAAIAAIAADGRSLTLTTDAQQTASGVSLSVPVCGDTRTGDVLANNTLISNISADVQMAGWKVSMPISGAQIPPETTIVSIDPGSRAVRISNPTTAAANRMIITVPAASIWVQTKIYDKETVRHSLKYKIFGRSIPPDLELTCIAPHDSVRGIGSLYVGTAGNPADEHLWWFDGVDTWRATGLRLQLADSPIYAVVVDPADRNLVYVGTEHGVWQARINMPSSGVPGWTWTYFATGLPEAACVDLAITTPADPAQRVLRATMAGLGVWEARLNLVQSAPTALYLRGDPFDQRLEELPSGGGWDPLHAQGRQLRLDASPDLRVLRRAAQLRVDTKNGNTHSNATVDGLAQNVRLAGWRVGAPISDSGKRIPPRTRIKEIRADGLAITLSSPAAGTANGVALSVPVLGNTQLGSNTANHLDIITLPVDVRNQGWQVDMLVLGDNIPPFTTIVSIDTNGRSVKLSLPAEATITSTPLTALPAVPGMQELPGEKTEDKYDIWLLQSGLHAEGADLTPDGVWSKATSDALDARGAALGLGARPAATAAALKWDGRLWQGVVLGNRLPYEHAIPDHADLALHTWDEPDRWPKGRRAASAANSLSTVQITVHSRVPLAANTVKVVLLKTAFAETALGRPADLLGVADLPVTWANDLMADINQAAPNGAWLGANWFYADPANPARTVAAALDSANPQVVSFDIDLTGDPFDKPGWLLLAVVYSANDDRLVTRETRIATLVRTDRHVAARSVRAARVLPSQPPNKRAWAGMDISSYPGRAIMDKAWRLSNILWTGLYLDSPRPEPDLGDPSGGGHNRFGTKAGHWRSAWNELHDDWGILVIYWGQQGGGANDGPKVLVPQPPNPHDHFPADAVARANAADAVSKAYSAGISPGAVIYLDYEDSAAANADAIAYCNVLLRVIAESGFRPGIYGHAVSIPGGLPAVTKQLRDVIPGIVAWNVRYNPATPPPTAWRLWRGLIILDTIQPVGMDDPQALMRQWAQDSTLPALKDENGVVKQNPVDSTFLIDLDLGFLQDPAFPERRSVGNRIGGGRAATMPLASGGCAVYAVRQGQLKRGTWPAVANVAAETFDEKAVSGWNPLSPMAALALPGCSGEALLALGYQEEEGEDIWRLQALRWLGKKRRWQHQTVPMTGARIDPLPGVAACYRSGGKVQAIAVDDANGGLMGACFSPQQSWSPLSRLVDAGGAPVTPPITRTNRPAVVSRDTGLADVFWAQPTFSPLTVTGATNATPILITTNAPHNLITGNPVIIYGVGGNTEANGAFTITQVSATSFTLNGSRGNGNYGGGGTVLPIDQRLYTSASTAEDPNHWSVAARIGPDNVRAHPLANLVALSASPGRADVLFVGREDGATAWSLYDYYWETADRWGNPGHAAHLGIVGPPAVDIDPLVPIAACPLNASRIDVYLAGVDGALYTTHFDPTGAPAFEPFRQIGGAPPAHIIAVEAAVAQGGSQLSVFATGSDGLLYGLSSTGPIAPPPTRYTNLAPVAI